MKIDILCVGKIKENYFRDGIVEYCKRLSRYATVQIMEVKDEKTPENAGEKEECRIMKAEAQRLEKYRNENAVCIVLAIEGKQMSSEEFSDFLIKQELSGKSHLQFIIGGSLGIDEELKRKADYFISFSKMTFPHQMMRMILLEQIYRGYRIKCNEPYHK